MENKTDEKKTSRIGRFFKNVFVKDFYIKAAAIVTAILIWVLSVGLG